MSLGLYSIASNYLGTSHSLNGCVNDQNDLIAKLKKIDKDIQVFKLTNHDISKETVIELFDQAVKNWEGKGIRPIFQYSGHGTRNYSSKEADGYSEGWYLDSSEVFWDYLILEQLQRFPKEANVIVFDDSCYSGGEATLVKSITGIKEQLKFVQTVEAIPDTAKKKALNNEVRNFSYLSASSNNETSCDAYLSGRFNGAFTYYLLKWIDKNSTPAELIEQIGKNLPSYRYEQTPALSGNKEMFNTKIFI